MQPSGGWWLRKLQNWGEPSKYSLNFEYTRETRGKAPKSPVEIPKKVLPQEKAGSHWMARMAHCKLSNCLPWSSSPLAQLARHIFIGFCIYCILVSPSLAFNLYEYHRYSAWTKVMGMRPSFFCGFRAGHCHCLSLLPKLYMLFAQSPTPRENVESPAFKISVIDSLHTLVSPSRDHFQVFLEFLSTSSAHSGWPFERMMFAWLYRSHYFFWFEVASVVGISELLPDLSKCCVCFDVWVPCQHHLSNQPKILVGQRGV
jgi:hypothetical protein